MKKAGEFLTQQEALDYIERVEKRLGRPKPFIIDKDIFSGKFVVYDCETPGTIT